jgi:hypothetical protein
MLCEYKNMLGIPGKGVHTHIAGVAIIDVIMTIAGSWILAKAMNWDYVKTLGAVFLLGIALHRLFCVKTTVDKLLFSNI